LSKCNANRDSISGTLSQFSLSCEGSSTKSRTTRVPDNDGNRTSELRPCSAWPNSWNKVTASSQLTRIGAPPSFFRKLVLLDTMGETGRSNLDCSRYSLIHAPEFLPVRAYGSKYQSPMGQPVSDLTSHTRTSGSWTATPVTWENAKPYRRLAAQNMASRNFSSCKYGFTSFLSRSNFARRTFSA